MIYVTVGTQLPFDRLIKTMDEWAGANPSAEVFAQIGPSEIKARHITCVPFVTPDISNQKFREAELVVSHAGMGSIITALKHKKPILILPRLASLGEHRNDHQLATAKWLGVRKGINVAWSELEIPKFLDGQIQLSQGDEISDSANPEFINKLRDVIFMDRQADHAAPFKWPFAWTWHKH